MLDEYDIKYIYETVVAVIYTRTHKKASVKHVQNTSEKLSFITLISYTCDGINKDVVRLDYVGESYVIASYMHHLAWRAFHAVSVNQVVPHSTSYKVQDLPKRLALASNPAT